MQELEIYAKLKGRIREKYRTQKAFAEAIGINPSTLSSKLNGESQWTYAEVVAACKALEIPLAEASLYFFS